jgi:hypothetical protein
LFDCLGLQPPKFDVVKWDTLLAMSSSVSIDEWELVEDYITTRVKLREYQNEQDELEDRQEVATRALEMNALSVRKQRKKKAALTRNDSLLGGERVRK